MSSGHNKGIDDKQDQDHTDAQGEESKEADGSHPFPGKLFFKDSPVI